MSRLGLLPVMFLSIFVALVAEHTQRKGSVIAIEQYDRTFNVPTETPESSDERPQYEKVEFEEDGSRNHFSMCCKPRVLETNLWGREVGLPNSHSASPPFRPPIHTPAV